MFPYSNLCVYTVCTIDSYIWTAFIQNIIHCRVCWGLYSWHAWFIFRWIIHSHKSFVIIIIMCSVQCTRFRSMTSSSNDIFWIISVTNKTKTSWQSTNTQTVCVSTLSQILHWTQFQSRTTRLMPSGFSFHDFVWVIIGNNCFQ